MTPVTRWLLLCCFVDPNAAGGFSSLHTGNLAPNSGKETEEEEMKKAGSAVLFVWTIWKRMISYR
ncbi:MAG: hypothetical protein WD315_00445 [Balneolaceae bacterium]